MLHGLSSMATRLVLDALAAGYRGGDVRVESIGGVDAERRVQSGEACDFIVLAAAVIERLAASGHVQREGSVDIARSGMAIAVRAGSRHPDVSSEAAFREALLAARRVGYSSGPSGNYLSALVERWGIGSQVELVLSPPGVPVGARIARGEADIGVQQMSELIGVPGIDMVGPLPAEIQLVTVFRAAVCTASSNAGATRRLLSFLASPETAAVKRRFGMEP